MTKPFFISDKGNIGGVDPTNENTFDYMMNAYKKGYYVKCDVQTYKGVLYFGDREPSETINWQFIMNPKVICSAADIETFVVLYNLNTHCFWYQNDDVTLTTRALLWCKQGVNLKHSKAVWNYTTEDIPEYVFGYCGDIKR